jgi:hypothetical protein
MMYWVSNHSLYVDDSSVILTNLQLVVVLMMMMMMLKLFFSTTSNLSNSHVCIYITRSPLVSTVFFIIYLVFLVIEV